MTFGVIYTLDTPSAHVLEDRTEIANEANLEQTEGDDLTQYDHYDGWEESSHRKWVGHLSKEEMRELAWEACCYPISPNERGSALGMPGAEPFFASVPCLHFDGPARFRSKDQWGPRPQVSSMAVTPYPEMAQNETWALDDRETDRLMEALYNYFN